MWKNRNEKTCPIVTRAVIKVGGWEKSTVGWSEKASTAGILETQIMSRPSDDLGEERTDSGNVGEHKGPQ